MTSSYRRQSVHGTGKRRKLSHQQKTEWRKRIMQLRRQGELTGAERQIAEQLPWHLGADGWLSPKHSTIAAWAVHGISTVKRALQKLKALAMLTWERRITVGKDGVRQTSNAYCLTGETAENRENSPDAQTGRPKELQALKTAETATHADRRAANMAWWEAEKALKAARDRRREQLFPGR